MKTRKSNFRGAKTVRIILKVSLVVFLVGLLMSSCSKFEIEQQKQINTKSLSIDSIDTQLDIIHIQLDSIMFDSLMKKPNLGVETDGLFSYYSGNSNLILNKKIELKNKGTSTLYYPLKSFKIKFDKKLNNQLVPIFWPEKVLANHSLNELKKISIRNSGNDFFYTMIKDISLTALAIDLELDLELGYYKPVQVFINTQYYGLLNMRTEKDDNSLGKLLNVDNDDINILKISHNGDEDEIYDVESENEEIILELISAINGENLPFLLERIDLNSFSDYVAFEDFIGNRDWPYNNVQIYSVGTDGKFRFFLYDLDMSLNTDKYFALKHEDGKLINKLYHTLMRDASFNELMQQKREKIYQTASQKLFNTIINNNATKIEYEIDYNIAKYNIPESKTSWYYQLERLKEQFAFRRTKWAEHYGLK